MIKIGYFLLISLFSFITNDNLKKDIQASKVSTENADVLVYEMNYLNTIYTYEMSLYKEDSIGLVVNWKMKNALAKSGKITITNDAFQNASLLQMGFQSGDKILDKGVNVLLSKKMYGEFTTKSVSNIFLSPTDGNPVKLIKQENSFTNCMVNGQLEKLFTSTVTGFRNGKPVKILYWDNADFPVILSSEQDITLKLVEIKTK
jgi:hypothetical protein